MSLDESVPDPADAQDRPDETAVNAAPPETTESPVSVADLTRERDEYYDRWIRKTAEFDNYRKRVERERREQADESVVRLLGEVLLIADDLERALGVDAGEDSAGYRRGVELIFSKVQDVLRKYHVTPIEALGADFDPTLHQAVIQEVSADHREGEVIGELQRGYRIGDRLLRPSMVKVAKA